MNDDRDQFSRYPNTYVPIKGASKVFDPALRHFPRSLRAGEPKFESGELRMRWIRARGSVIDWVLTVIHASAWRDRLVMRGSYLLRSWVGDEAREPGDLDFVYRPSNVEYDSADADRLLLTLTQGVADVAYASYPTIDVDAIATDEIWTYSRSTGRRIVFPFHAEGLPDGYVQVDIVFGEELLDEPVLMDLPLSRGGSLPLLTASKRLSLAWKLLWLQSDSDPQGKDLYDAVLLARLTDLPWGLLDRVLSEAGEGAWSDAAVDSFMVEALAKGLNCER